MQKLHPYPYQSQAHEVLGETKSGVAKEWLLIMMSLMMLRDDTKLNFYTMSLPTLVVQRRFESITSYGPKLCAIEANTKYSGTHPIKATPDVRT